MKILKKSGGLFLSMIMTLIAFVAGASSGVSMAAAADLPDAGVTNSGGPTGTDGIATETQGRADGDPEFYTKDIDSRITKIRPMATPIDQISRHAKSQSSDSFEVK